MTERLHLSPKHRGVIEALLREHLPGVEVWAYGSRVDGRSHEGSDLDLVLRGPGLQEIPVGQVGDFEEAVRDSSIPFLVEARDWARLPERFHREVERGYVVLVEGGKQKSSGVRMQWWDLPFSDAVAVNPSVRLERGKSYPFVDMAAINVGCRSIYASQHREFRGGGARFQTGDTLMARITPCLENGKIARYFASDAMETAHGSTEFIVIRGRPGITDTEYAYYLTQWEEVRNYAVGQMTGTSGRQRVPVDSLDHLMVPIPPLPEQRAIAHILGTLDDKIELNRRMNETLEAMARALFKSWFVDFDPVRAKAVLRNHAPITPPLRGSRGDKGASPQASRWGESGATQPPRPWPDIKRQYAPKTLQHAQTLRQNQTNAEGLLWHYLRNKQLGGYKFRRQQPIGPYIADFACLPEKLLIELDGGQHADPSAPDEQRDRFLRQQGYRVLRFWNHEVFADCFGVLERAYEALTDPPPLQPAPDGLASATPPQGGSDWSVDRARVYLDSMDLEIAALFPDRFVDSELGEIPAGWEVKALPELIEVNPKRSLQRGELAPYLDMANMPTKGHVPGTVIQRPFSSGMRFANGDTLVARITPCLENGKTAYVDFLRDGEIGWGSTEYIVMRPKSPLPSEFAYCLARSVEFRDFAIQNMTGTSGRQRVPAKALSQFMFLLAPDQIAESFGRAVQPLLRRASRAVNNSRALAAFRDTLLPKLISGELRLRGWEGGQSCGPEC